MKVPRREIVSALNAKIAAFGDADDAERQALAAEIAAYLVATRRTGEIDSIMRDVMRRRQENGIVEVLAYSAYPLTPETRGDIEAQVRSQFPQARQVIVSEIRDSRVVAGVRLEVADSRLDLSVRNKLNRLKQLTAAR